MIDLLSKTEQIYLKDASKLRAAEKTLKFSNLFCNMKIDMLYCYEIQQRDFYNSLEEEENEGFVKQNHNSFSFQIFQHIRIVNER